jgi:hypothetical protein
MKATQTRFDIGFQEQRKQPSVVKKDFAMLVVICYWATTAAIQQAMKFILP